MADEDKEKAEKLAAAKKRFEQLKKEQQKKGKKGGSKKKEDKAAKDEAKAEVEAAEAAVGDEAGEDKETPEDDKKPGEDKEEDTGETAAKDEESSEKPSESKQSKQRSESFRQGSSGPLSPGAEVQDLYKKQASRIEELEKESKSYRQQQEEGASRLAKAEEELEKLREDSSDVAELKTKSKEAETLKEELASVQRQLSQAQQQAAKTNRRQSTTSPDLSAQLANKTSTIESLELELSNLRNQVNGLQTSLSERDASVKDLEGKVQTAETASDAYKQEIEELKTTLAASPPKTEAEEGKDEKEIDSKETADDDQPSKETLTTRITLLESDLRTATTNLTTAQDRAQSLEQKIETLTKLHREATSAQTGKDAELTDLRQQVQQLSHRRGGGGGEERKGTVQDKDAAGDFELSEDETETGILQARIRALEAENFDLRSGVWREKRAALQPGMNDDDNAYHQSSAYEDVDLNTSPHRGRRESAALHPGAAAPARQSSSFQDVLRSGISAFRGNENGASGGGGGGPYAHGRQQSLDLLEDDDGDSFDPEAFRRAQEEEGKRRIERVREVKRGLKGWKGWRVDLVGQREGVAAQMQGQGVGSGVFEI
ncbi:hypothetical protein KC340_g11654 [Hortaea werneckii]|nr:hypothetical protein KC342_g11996 [Hortaea werneckii]KAI7100154.1 hypothetical protein KC339_g7676 [Hortaea werneckii]KAI7227733.1 hypothetical protein KC365_g8764 [Hortaea werneckii]KAI7306694.1 hypothetical protein KC340_g11654 [Hortaea werneckii]KAI7392088.1 hypothetical protein KC328_g7199 [Hortaea werneckii]